MLRTMPASYPEHLKYLMLDQSIGPVPGTGDLELEL